MLKKVSLLSIVLLTAGAVAQAQNTTYNFVSNDGDPDGITGTITLDSPFWPGGSVSDVVSFSVSDPHTAFTSGGLVSSLANTGSFTWNASQITGMDLSGAATANFPDLAFFFLSDGGIGYELGNFFTEAPDGAFSDTGSWVAAPVPDVENSAALLGMVLAGWGSFRRFRR